MAQQSGDKKKRDRPSKEQTNALLEFIQENPALIAAVMNNENERVWRELSAMLNSILGGAVRETKAWVSCWRDMKARAIQKRRLLLRSKDDEEATPLSEFNLRVLNILDLFEEQNEDIPPVKERSPLREKCIKESPKFYSTPSTSKQPVKRYAPSLQKPYAKMIKNNPQVVDLTSENSTQEHKSKSYANNVDILNALKRQTTQIEECKNLFLEHSEKRNKILQNGMKLIADSILTASNVNFKNEIVNTNEGTTKYQEKDESQSTDQIDMKQESSESDDEEKTYEVTYNFDEF